MSLKNETRENAKSLRWNYVGYLLTGILLTSLIALGPEVPMAGSAFATEINTPLGKIYTGKSIQMTYTGPPVKLRWSNYYAEAHMVSQNNLKPYVEFIQQESQGKILFDPQHWGATLHNVKDGYRMCRSDSTDVTQGYTMYQAQSFQLMNATELPFAFPNPPVASLVMEELYPKYFKEEYEKVGVYLDIYPFVGNYGIASKKPIRKLEDLKGLKVRTEGSYMTDMFKLLGASPVFMPAQDSYNAFSKGVFDAIAFYTGLIVPWKFHEIAKYYTHIPDLGLVGIAYCLNTKTFDALPKDLKRDFYLLNRKGAQVISQGYNNMDRVGLKEMKENGMEVIILDPEEQKKWKAALDPAWDQFIEKYEKEGRPARQFIGELKALTEKYRAWSPEKIMDHVTENPVHGIISGF